MDKIMDKILDIMNNHQLVGIGDFTHGCYEMSKFKLDLLKYSQLDLIFAFLNTHKR